MPALQTQMCPEGHNTSDIWTCGWAEAYTFDLSQGKMWSMETKLHQNNDLELGIRNKYPPYMLDLWWTSDMFYCRTNVERGNKKFEDAVKSYSLLTSSTFLLMVIVVITVSYLMNQCKNMTQRQPWREEVCIISSEDVWVDKCCAPEHRSRSLIEKKLNQVLPIVLMVCITHLLQ